MAGYKCLVANVKNITANHIRTTDYFLIQSHLSYVISIHKGTSKLYVDEIFIKQKRSYNTTWPLTFRNCQAFICKAQNSCSLYSSL